MGAHVVMACRDDGKARKAMNDIKGSLEFIKLDLADKKSIKEFVDTFKQNHNKLDILINNAGIMQCPHSQTKDGFEMQFGVNHLGHFYLTSLLVDSLKNAPNSRVINVSSRAHQRGGSINLDDLNWTTRPYKSFDAYCQSKLANILFTKEFHNRYSEQGITAYSLHPGVIQSELMRHITGWKGVVLTLAHPLFWYISKDTWHGAQTTIYCAVAPNLEKESGKYFSNCNLETPTPEALDASVAKKLWEKSESLLGITFGDNK